MMDDFLANLLANALGQVAGNIVTNNMEKITTHNLTSFPVCQTIITREKSGYRWDKQVAIHTDKDGVHVHYIELGDRKPITRDEFFKTLESVSEPDDE